MRVRVAAQRAGSLLLALCPSIAGADPIRLVTDFRHAGAQAAVLESSLFNVAADAEHQQSADNLTASAWTSHAGTTAAADAHLTSMISADLLHLSGIGGTSATIAGSSGRANAMSWFEVTFDLERPHAYTLPGELHEC